MAYEIVDRLALMGQQNILNNLSSAVTFRERKKGQNHKVFKDSFDAKSINTNKFFFQKLNYLHYNPVSGKWNLASDFSEYEHSSASFYEKGVVKHFQPYDFRNLLY